MRCYGEREEDEEINQKKDGEYVFHIKEDERLSLRVKLGSTCWTEQMNENSKCWSKVTC